MKLTAAIAMSYPNSKVTMNGYDDPIFKIDEIDFKHDEFTLMRVSNGDIFHEPIDQCQLILTPIDKISDADLIEVGKIIKYECGCVGNSDKPAPDYMFMSGVKDEVKQLLSQSDVEYASGRQIIEMADYLRSKSYDIDYLIAAGVAVEKTH